MSVPASSPAPVPPAVPAPPVKRRGLGMAVSGLILLVIGAFLAVFAILRIVGGVAVAINVPTFDVPGTITQQLESGPSTVYALADGSPTFTPADVTIVGPKGEKVPVGPMGGQESVTLGDDTYRGVAGFTAASAGEYTVTVSDKAPKGRAAVSKSVLSTLGSSVLWIFIVVLGGLLVLVGIVLGIAGLVRKFSTAKAPLAPAVAAVSLPPGTAAGWYPDPTRPGGQRYWDGVAWTENRA